MHIQCAIPLVVTAAFIFPTAVPAQTVTEAVTNAIRALEDDWARAYLTKDGTILEPILGQEYYIIDWDGKRYSRQDQINRIHTRQATYSRVTNTVLDVRQYGDLVIAVGEVRFVGTTPFGESLRQAGSWQTIFAKRNGRWVAIASHAAPLPK